MTDIDAFLARYERGANSFEPELVAAQFTDRFMGGDPNGVMCARKDDALRRSIPQRQAFGQQIGYRFGPRAGRGRHAAGGAPHHGQDALAPALRENARPAHQPRGASSGLTARFTKSTHAATSSPRAARRSSACPR